MKQIITLAIALVAFMGATAQTVAYKDQFASVEVRGVAERKMEPNRVEVNILLSEAPSKGKIKIDALESQLATALKQADIDASTQLVVVGASSSAQKRTGAYQYKSYRVTAHSAAQFSALFDALASTEIVDASVGRMYHSDQAKIQQELQVEAMKNSQEVATNLVSAIGQGIGPAISIQYWNNSPSPSNFDGTLRMASKSAGAESAPSLPSNVQLRTIELRVDVTVNYQLKGK